MSAEEETRTPTALTATAPSTLRVYQFHHLGLAPSAHFLGMLLQEFPQIAENPL